MVRINRRPRVGVRMAGMPMAVVCFTVIMTVGYGGADVELGNVVTGLQLPPGFPTCRAQPDGSLVVCVGQSMFISADDDALHWTEAGLLGFQHPHEGIVWPVGGNAECVYLLVSDYRARVSLYALSRGSPARKVRDMENAEAAFASAVVGAVTEGRAIELTTDGGANWHSTNVPSGDPGRVSHPYWVDETLLLVVSSRGAVSRYDRVGNALFRAWTTEPSGEEVLGIEVDGDFVWIGRAGGADRIALSDGQKDASIRFEPGNSGYAVCNGRVLAWNKKSLGVWVRNGETREYVKEFGVEASNSIGAVISLAAPRCLVLTDGGEAQEVDLSLGRIAARELQVLRAPSGEVSPEQLNEYIALLGKLSEEERHAIITEGQGKMAWTPARRVEWANQEMRKMIECRETGMGAATQPARDIEAGEEAADDKGEK